MSTMMDVVSSRHIFNRLPHDVVGDDAAHGDARDCFKTSVLTMSSLRSMLQSYDATAG